MTRPAVSPRHIALLLAGGSFLLAAAPAVRADETTPSAPLALNAARLNIAPLRLELDAGKSSATVMLTNTSDRPVPVQARLFAWSQDGGEDQFAPSNALTISPSIIAIPAGATQIVRLIRNGAASPGEKRFRLAVDQLPDPSLARAGEAEARIRFTVPVFFDRDKAAPAKLAWRITASGVEASNTGGSTARIVSIEAKTGDGKTVSVQRNSLRYIHGNSTIAWPLANGCSLGPLTITAQVDGQTANVQAPPACS
jgi:fimbrial chaperone protein